MTKLDKIRVLLRVSRDMLLDVVENAPDLDEPDRAQLRDVLISLETSDGVLYSYAPDMGEPVELGGE